MNANQWQWREGVLTCELLSDWSHGFFTRSHAPKLPADLHHHLAGSGKAYRAKQVHGNRLIHANEIETIPDAVLPEADGVWLTRDRHSTNCHRSVWVCTADCVKIG